MVEESQASNARLRWLPAGSADPNPPATSQPTDDDEDDTTINRQRYVPDEDDPTIARPGLSHAERAAAVSSASITAPSLSSASISASIPNGAIAELSGDYEGPIRIVGQPQQIIDGRYQLVARIGTGGMGEVWEARQLPLDRVVAIKFLTHEEGGPRFLREAQSIIAVAHDGVVHVHDFGVTPDGVPYFVMDRLYGRTLDTVIREHGPLPWTRVRQIALELSDALAHAHARGVIHRDLKPSNVFMLDPPPVRGSSTKLIDFGIVKLLDGGQPKLTKTGYIQGTPAYMAPEQVLGEAVDGRTDVYGLGCLLYFMLTGRRPFEGATGTEALYSQIYVAPPTFSAVVPELNIPPTVEQMVFRALSKRPEDRFGDMQTMHAAIAAIPAAAIDISAGVSQSAAAMTGPAFARPAEISSFTPLPNPGSTAQGQRPREQGSQIGVVIGAAIFGAALLGLALVAWMIWG
jgi:serine/threonine protein kinase